MRQAIETAPKDGKVVILEDDASGTYDVARWSAEAGGWVGKNGEPSKIKPTHWHPMSREKYLLQKDKGSSNAPQVGRSASRARRYSFFGAGQQDIARISTIGGQVVAQETPLPRQDSRKPDLLALQQQAEADQARAQAGAQQAAQVKQAVEASAPEARQSPENEQSREVLANELAEARRALAEARRAIDARNLQIDARDLQLHELENELAMVRREIATNVALLTELQQERDRAEAAPRELAMAGESARRADGRERAANGQIAEMTQVAEAAATERSSVAEAQGSPEATRLIARASALLGQGNIGAARIVLERIVLERAAETGSAQASFMLAETYDPVILSAWGTYGTRGEATKAREFYAKAHAGGIPAAKDRLNALR